MLSNARQENIVNTTTGISCQEVRVKEVRIVSHLLATLPQELKVKEERPVSHLFNFQLQLNRINEIWSEWDIMICNPEMGPRMQGNTAGLLNMNMGGAYSRPLCNYAPVLGFYTCSDHLRHQDSSHDGTASGSGRFLTKYNSDPIPSRGITRSEHRIPFLSLLKS